MICLGGSLWNSGIFSSLLIGLNWNYIRDTRLVASVRAISEMFKWGGKVYLEYGGTILLAQVPENKKWGV